LGAARVSIQKNKDVSVAQDLVPVKRTIGQNLVAQYEAGISWTEIFENETLP
jgi:hypothetical protein